MKRVFFHFGFSVDLGNSPGLLPPLLSLILSYIGYRGSHSPGQTHATIPTNQTDTITPASITFRRSGPASDLDAVGLL